MILNKALSAFEHNVGLKERASTINSNRLRSPAPTICGTCIFEVAGSLSTVAVSSVKLSLSLSLFMSTWAFGRLPATIAEWHLHSIADPDFLQVVAHWTQQFVGAVVVSRAAGSVAPPNCCASLASDSSTAARTAEKMANFEAFGSSSIGSKTDGVMVEAFAPGPVGMMEWSLSLFGAYY